MIWSGSCGTDFGGIGTFVSMDILHHIVMQMEISKIRLMSKCLLKDYLNCTKCGSWAVTMNGKTCIQFKRTGKVCNGKIVRIKGLLTKNGLWKVKTQMIG